MFTQCSKCETVYRLSAEALRAAGGQVRCGRCGEVFNALSRLAEDVSGFTKGESPLFLETRAEEILESSSSDLSDPPAGLESSEPLDASTHPDLDLPPGVEVAQLQFIGPVDDELAEETSLEFTLPPGELDRIFVENRPSPLKHIAADGHRAERADDVIPPHPESSAKVSAAPVGGTWAQPTTAALVPAQIAAPDTLPQVTAPQDSAPPLQPLLAHASGLAVSEAVRQEMLSSLPLDAGRDPLRPRSRSRLLLRSSAESPSPAREQAWRARLPFAAWLAAAILLGILLVIQVVRGNSDWVAVHVPVLGGPGSAASLSVYQLRQWGVTGDPAAKGTLRVRASIMNTATQLQPYPLLRVTLVNRFGTHVGTREFEPVEYLGHGITRLLGPGERVDATLDILDPGKDAEGFEIDVCIRSADKKIVCAADAAVHPK